MRAGMQSIQNRRNRLAAAVSVFAGHCYFWLIKSTEEKRSQLHSLASWTRILLGYKEESVLDRNLWRSRRIYTYLCNEVYEKRERITSEDI